MLRSILLVLLWTVTASTQQNAAPKIVFVCEHGAAKSVIAAKELEKLARERGIAVHAISRGATPDAEIPAEVRNGLKADGIEIGAMKPVRANTEDLRDAAIVVTFGPDVAAIAGSKLKAEDWSATPTVTGNFDAAREDIVKRVRALLDQIAPAKR